MNQFDSRSLEEIDSLKINEELIRLLKMKEKWLLFKNPEYKYKLSKIYWFKNVRGHFEINLQRFIRFTPWVCNERIWVDKNMCCKYNKNNFPSILVDSIKNGELKNA